MTLDIPLIQQHTHTMKTVIINGTGYALGTSTWNSDHGALFMLDIAGDRVCEWNTWREYDSIAASPDLLAAYRALTGK